MNGKLCLNGLEIPSAQRPCASASCSAKLRMGGGMGE